MRSTAHYLAAAYSACLDETVNQSPLMIERWSSGVVDLLNRRYASSAQNIEKRHLQAAKAALQHHRELIGKSFVGALTQAIAAQVQALPNTASVSPMVLNASVSFDDLRLVGDNDLQSSLDAVRVLQAIALESYASLAAFTARLSTAQGFTQVNADRNPLRPETFSTALVTAAHHARVDSATYSLWLAHGGAVMGTLINTLYLDLNELLIQKGVAPAAYRVITTREAVNADEISTDSAQNSAWADALETSAFAPLTDEPRELPTITFPMSGVAAHEAQAAKPNRPPTAVDGASQSKANAAVSLMINTLANDPRLLAPVGRIVAQTLPIFLAGAAKDTRVISDASHPARRLLAAIASKSLAYSSPRAAGFAGFLEDLHGVVSRLERADITDTLQVTNLLTEFENKWVQRQTLASENRRGSKQSILELDQRNLIAKQIAAEIFNRPDYVHSDPIVADFLTGPWSQVLASERQAVESDTTGMRKAIFSLTLGELLWSLNVERAAAHPKRLAKLSPSILDRIRGGLLSIDLSPAESQAFFDSVFATHQAILDSVLAARADRTADPKPGASARQDKTRSTLNSLFAAGDQIYGADAPQAALIGQQLRFGKNLTPGSKPRYEATQPFVETAPASRPAPSIAALRFDGFELGLGAWVDMTLNSRQVRAQLTWISLYQTLCIFTSADGATHPMAEPLLHYLLLQGEIKIISPEGVLS